MTNRKMKTELPRPVDTQAQGGYALVSLILVLSLLALFALGAAENVRHQTQREREKEAIFRGEQVADAIRWYYQAHGGGRGGVNALPTSMDQLLEGIPRGTKKLQILRAEAAHDPLSKTGEWKPIGPTSEEFVQFITALTTYSGGTPPTPKLAGIPIPQVTNILNTGSTGSAPGGEDDSAISSGPFIGVESRSQRNSVITYYGIDHHDGWLFTPLFR
jgi:type II secretory pathway pseudopilin PulG